MTNRNQSQKHRFLAIPSTVPALIWVAAAAAAQVGVEAPLSPRNASYEIEVKLDPAAKTLDARQVLTWRNIQDRPTDELWFHLYWNAWRNDRSTWMREAQSMDRYDLDDIRREDWGYQEVGAVTLLPPAEPPASELEGAAGADLATPEGEPAAAPLLAPLDLRNQTRFAAPDDGNPDDRTVMVVKLPRPVAPGEEVRLEMAWRAKVPRTFARTGYRGDYFFVAHWFPAVGVFEGEAGWNCHQFHAATEFFSDYGVYDVEMTVPEGFVLGATGQPVERRDNGDGTATHHYRQADVHTFTWTASPTYRVEEATFDEPGLPPVKMRLLFQDEHRDQVERHFEATRAALKYYGGWYGAYPYGHITIVDPLYESRTGGMEYPTLFTAGSRLFNPFGGGSPEGVTIHEAGHQFWYGLVANNEFEHAWLDEGLNTFSTARAYEAAFGARYFVKRYLALPGGGRGRGRDGFFPLLLRQVAESRAVQGNRLDRFRGAATADPQSTPTYLYDPASASQISYSKTSLWLATLERHLGWETLREILSTFFERWKFRHPEPEDFFAVANEVAGRDLGWFFDQVYGDSVTFDYAVQSVASKPIAPRGFVEGTDGALAYAGGGGEEPERYRTEVVVRREGEGVFPVEVVMVFEDGSEARHTWDGEARWTRFVEEKPARLRYAAVDPERVLLLDLNYTNNSRLMKSAATLPAVKWSTKWMVWLQDLLTTFTYFI